MQKNIRYRIASLLLVFVLFLTSCELLTGTQQGTSSSTEESTPYSDGLNTGVEGDAGGSPTYETTSSADTSSSGETSTSAVTTPAQSSQTNGTTSNEGKEDPEIELELKGDLYGFNATAPYAFVVDVRKGEIIYAKGSLTDKLYPASITKLVTALVALEYADKDAVFTVGDERSLVAHDSSIAGLNRGDSLTLDSLIYCLLLPSGGDAAYTIAAGVGRIIKNDKNLGAKDAVSAFVEEMNSFMKIIGMENTVFTCPDGYHDDGHYSSLEDIAKLGTYCSREGTLAEYTSCASKTVSTEGGRKLSLKNTNAIVNPTSSYYREYVDGLKTGTTDEGGYCLLTSGSVKNIKYIVGIFGAESTIVRFEDTIKAFNALSVR